ncbi:hypothetical protein [Moraxella lacunata]
MVSFKNDKAPTCVRAYRMGFVVRPSSMVHVSAVIRGGITMCRLPC